MLGLRAAAALPSHLHMSVLRLLLFQRNLSPFASSGSANYWPSSQSQSNIAGIPILKTRGATVKCLFSAWLTKQSKWLKATRLRYFVLLVIERQAKEHDPSISGTTGKAMVNERNTHFSEVLLVSFKTQVVSLSSPEINECSGGWKDGESSPGEHFRFPLKAEPSEIFSLNRTHVSSQLVSL